MESLELKSAEIIKSWLMRSKLERAAEWESKSGVTTEAIRKDGRLELTNNLAERSIKPFVIGRKNFLFANTSLGAIGSAVYYSLIETCKVSDINPYEYLVFALKEATELYETEKEDEIKYLTPAYYKAHLESTGEDL